MWSVKTKQKQQLWVNNFKLYFNSWMGQCRRGYRTRNTGRWNVVDRVLIVFPYVTHVEHERVNRINVRKTSWWNTTGVVVIGIIRESFTAVFSRPYLNSVKYSSKNIPCTDQRKRSIGKGAVHEYVTGFGILLTFRVTRSLVYNNSHLLTPG